jgi:ATP-dependent RNA circularization protein (DNA/RNA ligase family)
LQLNFGTNYLDYENPEVHIEYPKINSLWKREGWYFDQDKKTMSEYQAKRQSFIIGDYANPEIPNIRKWRVDEKIDGMNMRVYYNRFEVGSTITIKGRTDAAQIPPDLREAIETLFTKEKLGAVFAEKNPNLVEFFGEGYGPKIQSGGYYAKQAGFVLYDIVIDRWWLTRDAVREVAQKLELDMVPDLGIMEEAEIIEYVKSQPLSHFAKVQPRVSEGVVCRSEPLMLFRNGEPIKWKLKTKEFI